MVPTRVEPWLLWLRRTPAGRARLHLCAAGGRRCELRDRPDVRCSRRWRPAL